MTVQTEAPGRRSTGPSTSGGSLANPVRHPGSAAPRPSGWGARRTVPSDLPAGILHGRGRSDSYRSSPSSPCTRLPMLHRGRHCHRECHLFFRSDSVQWGARWVRHAELHDVEPCRRFRFYRVQSGRWCASGLPHVGSHRHRQQHLSVPRFSRGRSPFRRTIYHLRSGRRL
jgi:hypothetical protein